MILVVKTTGKSRGKPATTQRNEYCSVALGVRRHSQDYNLTAQRNTECTSETKPQGTAFTIGRTQTYNLEIHCAIAPRCIARLV